MGIKKNWVQTDMTPVTNYQTKTWPITLCWLSLFSVFLVWLQGNTRWVSRILNWSIMKKNNIVFTSPAPGWHERQTEDFDTLRWNCQSHSRLAWCSITSRSPDWIIVATKQEVGLAYWRHKKIPLKRTRSHRWQKTVSGCSCRIPRQGLSCISVPLPSTLSGQLDR